MKEEATIGQGGLGDTGDYDLFGLDEWGRLREDAVNPAWGAIASVGTGTLTSVGIRQFTDWGKWSELIGFGASAIPAAVMMFFERARPAAWTGLAAGFLNHGPRFVEDMLQGRAIAKAKTTATGPEASAGTQGWGMTQVEQAHALAGAGLGLVTPEMIRALSGAGAEGMPQLLGNAFQQAQNEVQILGGPQLSELGGRFGSTHFNKVAG